jgi:integral membrane sensor domain MASE1
MRTAVLTAAVFAWQIYDMATAAEAPSQALKLLQLFLLACAGIACVGSLVMLARRE